MIKRLLQIAMTATLTAMFFAVSAFGQSVVYTAGPDMGEIGVADLSESSQYFQGFETDAAWGSDPSRVASGTGGLTSKTGGFHAQAVSGNFTRWGGYSSVFPSLGFTTSIDVYFNMSGGYSNDTRFDFSSAASQPDGNHRRDFIFNCGFYSDAGPYGSGNRFVCSASNNSPGNPRDVGRSPVFVNLTGWYTLKHTFRNNGGVLAVDLVLLDGVGSVKGSWTLSDPTDIIGITVGGNRYGWFVTNGFPFLAIDNSKRANIIPLSTVKVTPVNYNGWMFYDDFADVVNNSLGSFVSGPASPNFGSGSAQISVIGATTRVNLATYQFSGTPLADINELKFRTYNPSAGNPGSSSRSAYLNFNVDFNGSDLWQNRLVYVPSNNGTVTQDNWKEWDAINGGNALWGYSRNTTWPLGVGGGGEPSGTAPGAVLKTWGQILSQYPGVRIRVTDSHLGLRVGDPYADGYTENIDSFTFGTATSTTTFDFDPAPLLVDDNTTECPTAPYTTIQAAINAAAPGATVSVCAGTYTEDVNINKAGLTLVGAGVDVSTIVGPHTTGGGDTVLISAPNVTVDGFTITRTGNTDVPLGSWAANTQNQGVNVAASTGVTIQNSKITGNRNGIYVGQSSHNATIRRNIIDFNRTGVHLVDNNNVLIDENFITNNWTMGILYRDEVPLGGPDPTGVVVRNNNISGNWYSQIEFRDPAGVSIMNMSGNYLGTTNPTRVTTTSLEPGYTAQIPAAYPGGSAVAPGSPTGTIAGPQSARVDYSPFLNSGVDTQPGTPGFQGNYGNVTVNVDSSSANGSLSNTQDGINLVSTGGTVTALAGTYNGNVIVNKAATLKGVFTINGTLSTSNSGAVLSPGNSPGIINSGSLSLNSGATVNMEVNGTTPGTYHDQLNVTGTVSLGGAALNVTTGYAPTLGDSMVIVNNDDTDAVTGTFAGLAEGATFVVSGTTFQITYLGGSGNDVVLSVTTLTCDSVSTANANTLTGVPVTVPVTTTNMTGRGATSADFTITYDPNVLTYNSALLGSVTAGNVLVIGPPVVVDPTHTRRTVSISGSVDFAGSGSLVDLNFTVIGLPGTSSPVTIGGFAYNEGNPCSTVSSGTISVISGVLSGKVTYWNPLAGPLPNPVPGVKMNAVGASTFFSNTIVDGTYSLSGFLGGPYTVTPSKTTAHVPSTVISGVDASLIAQHVVGSSVMTDANQLAVADVSGNGTITSFDASMIARYAVLLPNTGLTGNWVFVPNDRTYSSVYVDTPNENYVARLMGDVSGNWTAALSPRPAPRPIDGEKPLTIDAASVHGAPGTVVTVPVSIRDTTGKGIMSYQFDLRYDPRVLEPAANAADLAGTISDGYSVTFNSTERGLLRVVAFGPNALIGAGHLLNLKFNVIGDVNETSDLTWESFNINEGGINFEVMNGRVAVRAASNDAAIAGRVLSSAGQPVGGATVTLVDTNGQTRTARTSSLGNFRFAELTVGQTYTVSVSAKRYTFASQTVSVTGDAVTLDLIAEQ